jgi:hypothetical protein
MAIEDSTPNVPANAELPIPSSSPPQSTLTPRRLTVSYIGLGMPYLRLQGRWLEKAGFCVGTPVRIEVAEGRLTVSASEPEEPPHCADPDCPHETKNKRKRHDEPQDCE